jgi:Uri superfamily endonuclease
LYNTSGKDAYSVVVDRFQLDFEFMIDHKNYLLTTSNQMEAIYLASILNSSVPNEMMKDFQSKGLFGARDVHKKILDIYYPKFDESNETHQRLASLSQAAHQKATAYLQNFPPKQELSAIHLGRLRVEIKKHLATEMKEIDGLVKKLIG